MAAVEAVVRVWHEDEGWGVLDSAETPGGCWVHFSSVATGPGYKSLAAGTVVLVEYEAAEQDGHAYRAVRAWPAGTDPVESPTSPSRGAHTSTLTLTFDDDDEP